jgi:hypothetical protein
MFAGLYKLTFPSELSKPVSRANFYSDAGFPLDRYTHSAPQGYAYRCAAVQLMSTTSSILADETDYR